jgi:hypothetical protein
MSLFAVNPVGRIGIGSPSGNSIATCDKEPFDA